MDLLNWTFLDVSHYTFNTSRRFCGTFPPISFAFWPHVTRNGDIRLYTNVTKYNCLNYFFQWLIQYRENSSPRKEIDFSRGSVICADLFPSFNLRNQLKAQKCMKSYDLITTLCKKYHISVWSIAISEYFLLLLIYIELHHIFIVLISVLDNKVVYNR